MAAATAVGAVAVNEFPPNPAKASTGSSPVEYEVANNQIVASIEYDVGKAPAGGIPAEYGRPKAIRGHDTISDSYEYQYNIPKAYIVRN
jgi:hypothetical protein